jgi:KDO2-lipid IV(A) lauroyltransferase
MAESSPQARFYSPRYWPVWLGFGLLHLCVMLPWSWGMALGRWLGRLGMRFSGRRIGIADTNLRLCLPELSAAERQTLIRRHFESMGMGIMDMGGCWWLSAQAVKDLVRVHGAEHARAAVAGDRGVIFLTAHFMSLEMSARTLLWFGDVAPVYRPMRNPLVQKFVTDRRLWRMRKAYENPQVIPRDDVRAMLRRLRSGKSLWFAPDQNFGHKYSLFSPFFGIPAATNTATSRLAAMTKARVVPFVLLHRTDGPGYDLHFEPAMEGFGEGELQQDTDRMNLIFERWIRMAPEQYLWTHRRFKDRPEGEPSFY